MRMLADDFAEAADAIQAWWNYGLSQMILIRGVAFLPPHEYSALRIDKAPVLRKPVPPR